MAEDRLGRRRARAGRGGVVLFLLLSLSACPRTMRCSLPAHRRPPAQAIPPSRPPSPRCSRISAACSADAADHGHQLRAALLCYFPPSSSCADFRRAGGRYRRVFPTRAAVATPDAQRSEPVGPAGRRATLVGQRLRSSGSPEAHMGRLFVGCRRRPRCCWQRPSRSARTGSRDVTSSCSSTAAGPLVVWRRTSAAAPRCRRRPRPVRKVVRSRSGRARPGWPSRLESRPQLRDDLLAHSARKWRWRWTCADRRRGGGGALGGREHGGSPGKIGVWVQVRDGPRSTRRWRPGTVRVWSPRGGRADPVEDAARKDRHRRDAPAPTSRSSTPSRTTCSRSASPPSGCSRW